MSYLDESRWVSGRWVLCSGELTPANMLTQTLTVKTVRSLSKSKHWTWTRLLLLPSGSAGKCDMYSLSLCVFPALWLPGSRFIDVYSNSLQSISNWTPGTESMCQWQTRRWQTVIILCSSLVGAVFTSPDLIQATKLMFTCSSSFQFSDWQLQKPQTALTQHLITRSGVQLDTQNKRCPFARRSTSWKHGEFLTGREWRSKGLSLKLQWANKGSCPFLKDGPQHPLRKQIQEALKHLWHSGKSNSSYHHCQVMSLRKKHFNHHWGLQWSQLQLQLSSDWLIVRGCDSDLYIRQDVRHWFILLTEVE